MYADNDQLNGYCIENPYPAPNKNLIFSIKNNSSRIDGRSDVCLDDLKKCCCFNETMFGKIIALFIRDISNGKGAKCIPIRIVNKRLIQTNSNWLYIDELCDILFLPNWLSENTLENACNYKLL